MKNVPLLTMVYLLAIPLGFLFVFFNHNPLDSKSDFMTFLMILSFMYYAISKVSEVKTKFIYLFVFAIVCRLIFFIIPPSLSPDYYRFIWDGELLNLGINPYAYTPDELISNPIIYGSEYMRLLYHGMTDLSKVHYSNYPVLNQLFFYIPAYFSDSVQGNVLGLRIIVFLFDIGSIIILRQLLKLFKINEGKLWLYALNPLIIIEFTGNLHFEGVMIFFLLLSIYFIVNPKNSSSGWIMAALFLALSAQVKLIPLMFIPFFYKKLKWKKSLGFTAATLIVFLLIGQVLWRNPIYVNNMLLSINDYFVSFEFNSSIFSVVNYFKSKEMGWDTTYIIGPLLSKIAFVLIILLAILRHYKSDIDMIKGMMFALLIYYTLSTTVHPWYISMVLVLSIFTNYRVGFIWSLGVFLSYLIYVFSDNPVQILVAKITEYVLVLVVFIRDLILYKRKDVFSLNLREFFSS